MVCAAAAGEHIHFGDGYPTLICTCSVPGLVTSRPIMSIGSLNLHSSPRLETVVHPVLLKGNCESAGRLGFMIFKPEPKIPLFISKLRFLPRLSGVHTALLATVPPPKAWVPATTDSHRKGVEIQRIRRECFCVEVYACDLKLN